MAFPMKSLTWCLRCHLIAYEVCANWILGHIIVTSFNDHMERWERRENSKKKMEEEIQVLLCKSINCIGMLCVLKINCKPL